MLDGHGTEQVLVNMPLMFGPLVAFAAGDAASAGLSAGQVSQQRTDTVLGGRGLWLHAQPSIDRLW
jgi:hypothetical protein